MNYTAGKVSEITGSQIFGDENVSIHTIVYDSRIIFSTQNTAFIAITTRNNSGENYIQEAVDKGIKIIISEKKLNDSENITWIITDNAIDFLQKLAKFHVKQFPKLRTVGITGSNGKTTVKEWLYQSIFNEFKTVKSPKSFNSQIGLPISLLQIDETDEIGIFEAGISKPGEMQKLESIISPNIGVLSHIGTAHSANFKSENELIEEKLKLFENSEYIIFNGDHPVLRKAVYERFFNRKIISFGLHEQNDIRFLNDLKTASQELKIKIFNDEITVPITHRDDATLKNALCIVAILYVLGFKNEKIVEKINGLKAVEMRLESVLGAHNNLIINDSYNLDFDSLKIAYQFIREYKKKNKILVLTDFAEINDAADFYKKVANTTNMQQFDEIFLVGTEICNYKDLFQPRVYTFTNTPELISDQHFNDIKDALILLKGARKFEIDRVKSYLELQKHDTVLEVNLNAILHNINIHKSLLKPKTKMMAMVKAFSYGLGGYEIAEFLQHHHIDYLGVAYADEGVELRKNGITVPIMIMNPEQHSYRAIIDYNLEPEIYSFRVLDLFYNELENSGFTGKFPVHIKLETGMHRLGFKEDELENLAEKLLPTNVEVKSIFSHLSSADDISEHDYTMKQLETFEKNSTYLAEKLCYAPLRHILNTAGITNYPDYQYDMVRIGIGMAGISSNAKIRKQLQSAVHFKTVISQISEIRSGESVGYSRRFQPQNNAKIATVPVGYADGIPRLIGNGRGKLFVNGHLVPIVGTICMDMMMLDISNIEANEGDEVTIFNGNPSLEDFAEFCQTIPYEVLTSISRRVKRIYIKN